MLDLNNAAIASLTSTLEGLIPDAGAGIQRSLLVVPNRIGPLGLGGVTELNPDPVGQVHACRVIGTVVVSTAAPDLDGLDTAVGKVTTSLLGAGRAALLQAGIVKLDCDSVGQLTTTDNGFGRELRFSVLFEFLKRPDEAEGVIAEIPQTVTVDA